MFNASNKKKRFQIFLYTASILASAAMICACADRQTPSVREFFAMDTVMTVTVCGRDADTASAAAEAELRRLDALLSAADPGSEISALNTAGGGILSPDSLYLMREASDLYWKTDGLFDITIYPLMELWGFPSGQYHVPAPEELEQALALVGMSAVSLDEKNGYAAFDRPGMKIDFGGLAKGYASDSVCRLLQEDGIRSALINLGGNVAALGRKPDGSPWKIGIRDPAAEDSSEDSLLGVLEAADCAVVTSGGYERFFLENGRRYHHILDPRTGAPAESGLASVTIVCKEGLTADGLSTALFIIGEDAAISFWRKNAASFGMILLCDDGRLLVSEDLAVLFTPDERFRDSFHLIESES